MSNPLSSKRPPRDQFSTSASAAAAPSPYASDSDVPLPQSATQRRSDARSAAARAPYPAVSAAPNSNKSGGRRTATDEPLVRPSRKAPTNKARGVYAPVGQGHELSDDVYHDSSPPPTESDFDSEPESPPSKNKASRKKSTAAVAVGSDVEKGESDEPQPSTAWSTTRKLVVGGLVLLALLLIIVLIFLVTKGTSSSSSAKSGSAASQSGQSSATSQSNATESDHANNNTDLRSDSHASTDTSHLESVPSASLVRAVSSVSSSSQADVKTAAAVTAGSTLPEVQSQTAATANVAATDHVVATAVSTGTPFPNSSLQEHEDPQTVPALSTFSDSLDPLPSGSETRPATSTATGAPGVPGTTKMTTSATWFGQHLSACHEIFDDSTMAAAVSPLLFGSDGSSPSELCGAKIRVWQPNSKKTVTLSIMDVCNTCPKATAIDLTQGAFLKLAPGGKKDPDAALEKGVLSVQWWFDDPAMQAKLPIGFEHWDNDAE